MICNNCGCEFADGSTFCPNCGFATEGNAAQQNKPDFQKAPPPPVYDPYNPAPPQMQQTYGAMPPYTPAYAQFGQFKPQLEEPMSVKDWVVTFLISSIPVAGVIMLFIWAFGGDAPRTKSNYAKAMLIFQAVSVVFGIIIGIFSALLGMSFAY